MKLVISHSLVSCVPEVSPYPIYPPLHSTNDHQGKVLETKEAVEPGWGEPVGGISEVKFSMHTGLIDPRD